jgi:P-type Ca2+ transporter type 2C
MVRDQPRDRRTKECLKGLKELVLTQIDRDKMQPESMKPICWHSTDADTVLQRLGSSSDSGLTAETAAARLAKHGFNELHQETGISAVTLLLNQFKNTLILILLAAIGLSAAVGEVLDALLVLAIVIFCAVLGFVQEYRADRAMESLRRMLSPSVTAVRDGIEQEIPSRELVPGDILILETGDRIAADARLLEAHILKCDEAALTGESLPVQKHLQVVAEDADLAERFNMVYAGTVLSYGRARAVVVATGMQTELGGIATEVAMVEAEASPLEQRTREIAKWLGVLAIGICVLVAGISVIREMLVGQLDTRFLLTMLVFSIALAVAAVPEALPAIVTGALAIGMHQMARRNALIRRMPAVETLGCTTVICTDKTGTLTRGEMTVRQIAMENQIVTVSGIGYAPEGQFTDSRGQVVPLGDVGRWLILAGVLCNDARLLHEDDTWTIQGDPTEAALLVVAAKAGLDVEMERRKCPRLEEIPFCSERKRMTTVHSIAGGQRMVFCKGAPEELLKHCTQWMTAGGIRNLDDTIRDDLQRINEFMADAALRVLALAFRELPEDGQLCQDYGEDELVFLGMMGMMDPPRPEVINAIQTCQQVSIRTVMITGDHPRTAVAVAKEVGIFRNGDRVMSGEELAGLNVEELSEVVEQVSVYARVSPLDKLKIVQAWKERGEVVAMTGDGVNDAPALKRADIGIAMGLSGTDVAREAADMVLNDDNFATIVVAIERGRWIYDNIKKYLTYLLRCNLTEVAVIGGVVLVMGPDFLPLLPAAILYINLATDGLPALALGIAPPDPDIMRRPPRNPKEGVFTREVRAFIVLALLVEVPLFFYLFLETCAQIERARTMLFLLFIVVELTIALNFRSMRYSVFDALPHRWLVLAVVSQAILTGVLLQSSMVRQVLGVSRPAAGDLVTISCLGLAIFISIELLKWGLRTRSKWRPSNPSS